MLSELIVFTEQVRAALVASEAAAEPGPGGVVSTGVDAVVDRPPDLSPTVPADVRDRLRSSAAAGWWPCRPSPRSTAPRADDVERYLQAANAPSRERIRLFRLAWDAAGSGFSGRQQLYERYYSGDPVRLAAALFDLYDADPYKDRIDRFLDDLEARQQAPGTGRAFT